MDKLNLSEGERDVTESDLPKPSGDEPDRFDEHAMGVKKSFRPDWLHSENTLFINKLNFVTKNFQETHNTTKKLKTTVNIDHNNRLDDLELKLKDLSEEHLHTRTKLDSMENNLPRMIREMIDYYSDQKLNPKFEKCLQKSDFEGKLAMKMDHATFNEYVRMQQESDSLNDKEYKTDERLYIIEKRLDDAVNKEDLKLQLKTKASSERFSELRENLHKLQVMSISSSEKYDKEIKMLEQDLGKKTSELNSSMQDMRLKLKSIEDEMNDGETGNQTSNATFPKTKQGSAVNFKYEDDMPNIDEQKELDVMGVGKILRQTASDGDEDPEIDLNNPLRGSKTLSKKMLTKKFGDDGPKSPAKDGKKKKKTSGGDSKETTALIKKLESSVEELRKQAMGEINRLEAKLENEALDSKQYMTSIQEASRVDFEDLSVKYNNIHQAHSETRSFAKGLAEQVKTMNQQVEAVASFDPQGEINKLQRRLIKDIVVELLTPVQRNFNVDFKSLRKIIGEIMSNLKEHSGKHGTVQKQIDEMNLTLVRALKNSDMDKSVLNRELTRMQHIDRLKVAHAKDSFYNPDTTRLLPSLNTAHASGSVNAFITQSQGFASMNTPQQEGGRDYMSMISDHDIVTKTEIKGICERFGNKPSARQRIIIARSQDTGGHSSIGQIGPLGNLGLNTSSAIGGIASGQETERIIMGNQRPHIGSLDSRALDDLNKTHHFKNDSKMSIQDGVVQTGSLHTIGGGNPLFQNASSSLRPFDVFGRNHGSQGAVNFKDGSRSLNQTIDHKVSTDAVTGHRQTNITVDITTPEIPDALERIKNKARDKKKATAKQKKEMEKLYERAREEVLECHNIKSVL